MICPEIRSMSFNVQSYEDEEDDTNLWAKRAALNVKTIKRFAPDIIGFQELSHRHMTDYREHLADYDHTALPNTVEFEDATIFWLREKYELLDAGQFWLRPTPEVPSTGWGVEEDILSARWVKLRERKNGAQYHPTRTRTSKMAHGVSSRVRRAANWSARGSISYKQARYPRSSPATSTATRGIPAYRIFMSQRLHRRVSRRGQFRHRGVEHVSRLSWPRLLWPGMGRHRLLAGQLDHAA